MPAPNRTSGRRPSTPTRRVTGEHRGTGGTLGMHTSDEECTTQRGRLKHSAQLRRNFHHPCPSTPALPSAEEECYDFACRDNACPCGEHTHGDAGCYRLSTAVVSVQARVGASLWGCTTLSQRDGVSSETPH